jgi:hypothetical protein
MARVYRDLALLIIAIAGGLYPILQLHLPLQLELFVMALYFAAVTTPTVLYLRFLETEMGISIMLRPKLDLLLETDDKESVRDVFYSISRQLASGYHTLGAGQRYLLETVLNDHLPYALWIKLSFLKAEGDDHSDDTSKSAEGLYYSEDKVMTISCGYFGGKEPFELLENKMKAELSKESITYRELFTRRPH